LHLSHIITLVYTTMKHQRYGEMLKYFYFAPAYQLNGLAQLGMPLYGKKAFQVMNDIHDIIKC
jgi:hypothetical protein